MKSVWASIAAVGVALTLASSANAAVRVGVLRCYVQGGPSYVVGSAHEARCVYHGAGRRERYHAFMKRVGVDVGYTGQAVLTWAVFAPSDLRHRALRGSYVGASADASLGLGVGANVLVGGNGRTISLQPLSVKTQTGAGVGAGFADLELR